MPVKRLLLILTLALVCSGLILGGKLKKEAVRSLIGLLDDEAVTACGGSIVYESASISLLTLSAEARNVKLMVRGTPHLTVKRLRARFGLRDILSRQVHLDHLELIGTHAEGVGEESGTFRFIDHLTAPLPPEKDTPDRWRILLERLTVSDGSFLERFRTAELHAHGVSLEVNRNRDDTFKLLPVINDISVRYPRPSLEHTFTVGGARSELTITSAEAIFHTIAVAHRQTELLLSATSNTDEDNELSGSGSLTLHAESLGISPTLIGTVTGTTTVTDTLGSPRFDGNLQGTPPLTVAPGGTPLFIFDKSSGRFTVDINHGDPIVSLRDITAQGGGTSIANGAFTLRGDTVIGSATLHLDHLTTDVVSAHDATLRVALSGTLERPELDLNLTATAGHFLDYNLGSFIANGTFRERILGFTLTTDQNTLRAKGSLNLSTIDDPSFTDLSLTATGLRVSDIRAPSVVDDLLISGSMALSGPLTTTGIRGKGTLDVSYQPLSGLYPVPHILKGNLILKDGTLSVTGGDETGRATVKSSIIIDGTTPSTLTLTLAQFTPPISPTEQLCLSISATTSYTFSLDNPLAGNGATALDSLRIGCQPYEMALPSPAKIAIKGGRANLATLALSGNGSALAATGWVSLAEGYRAKLSGGIRLESLLDLIPAVDNASGLFSGSVQIGGPIGTPSFTGSVDFSKGRVSLTQSAIEANEIVGHGQLDGKQLTISSLSGTINGGTATAKGTINLATPQTSLISATITGVRFDAIADLSTTADGDLSITWSPSLTPQLGGTLTLQSASFEKNIGLGAVAKLISQSLIGERQQTASARAPSEGALELNLTIHGDHDLFLATNWAEAELKADLAITGTSARPVIVGKAEALSGWFGFKETKFSLVSGNVIFQEDQPLPRIEILGQATILSSIGETNSVILEARGPADNPKILLSSDRGLSQREILALLTGGGGRSDLTRQSTMSRFGVGLNYRDISLFDQNGPLSGGTLLNRLIRIDTLSVEPAYNNSTGSIDPAVVPTKRGTDKISLTGEGLFSGPVSESRARLDYRLLDAVTLTGTLESNSLRQGTQLGVDVALTLKSKERVPLTISFIGNDALESSQILQLAKIKRTRPINAAQVKSLTRRVTTAYYERGYRSAAVTARCTVTPRQTTEGELCAALDIFIDEGEPHYVEGISLEGDIRESLLPRKIIDSLSKRTLATASFEQDARSKIIRHLREQGYFSNRVESSYQPSEAKTSKPGTTHTLNLRIDPGPRHTLVFTGNTHFSSDELLETVNLLDRTLPFGNNSIILLADSIAERYRRAGYLNATVSHQREDLTTENPEGKTGDEVRYQIQINEQSLVTVRKVEFIGTRAVSVTALQKEIKKRERTTPGLSLLSPRFAVDEDIRGNATVIEDIYRDLGYTGTTVSYEIIPSTRNRAAIRYLIAEGNRRLVRLATIAGLPLDISPPKLPAQPVSTRAINDLITDLAQQLKDAGYHGAALSLQAQSSNTSETVAPTFILKVHPGAPVTLSRIIIEGNVSVPNSAILNALRIREGQPWAQRALEEGRRKILKLGLFSSVLFSENPSPDPLLRELTIKVVERPLSFLRLGGGANSQFGAHVFGEASDRSLFLDGRELSFRADLFVLPSTLEVSQGIASVLYSIPSILDSPYSFVEDLRFQKLSTTTQEFDVERSIASSYLYRADTTGVGLTLGHSLARESIFNVPADVQLSRFDSGTVLLSSLNSSLTIDRRDAPLMPTSGYTLGFDGTLATNALGSDASYLSGVVRGSTILPLFSPISPWSLAASTRWGAAKGLSGTDNIPITQRFYLGGRNSIRGFRENSLGPRGELGNVIGGDILSASSIQLQRRVAERVSLHTFIDIGNVFLRYQHPSLTDQRTGYGVGVRFLSPIGPVGFDLGFPLNPEEYEPRMRFHFSVGSNY